MRPLSWTKFQDFYLRLGFLRAVAAVLDPQRRSTARELLLRRLEDVLFRPLKSGEPLADEVLQRAPWLADGIGKVTRVEALLISCDAESLLYAITKPTAYKILDWAHDVDIIGAGNQITESGLLLRTLLPESASDSSAIMSWNPFALTRIERAFFLFHLAEIDDVTMRVLDKVGARGAGTEIPTAEAAQILAHALSEYVDAVKDHIPIVALADLRKARQLAETIAVEVGLASAGPPKRPATGRGGLPRQPHARVTRKNADHQTIPRFEQLVDLGFLDKAVATDDARTAFEARKRWHYRVTPAAAAWAAARQGMPCGRGWHYERFAAVAAACGLSGASLDPSPPTAEYVLTQMWNAYERTRRPFGHTPFLSVALLAMLTALADGIALEMARCHEMMLEFKRENRAPAHAFFASGNEIDKMFVVLKPGFLEVALRS